MTLPVIHRITQLDLSVQPWSWRFAERRRADIDAHFAIEQREKPRIWNGRILLGRDPDFTEGSFSAQYFEADFASFLAWRDWGFPDKDVFNGFGMGALRTSDGAFVLGEMSRHTANAGRIYFPSGTPDLDDISGGAGDRAGRHPRRRGRHSRQRRPGSRGGDRPATSRLPGRRTLGLRGLGPCHRDHQDTGCRQYGRNAACPDRAQSR